MQITFSQLFQVILERKTADPQESYVASLFEKGEDTQLQKMAEECTELLLAAKNKDMEGSIHELADLWFHMLVWMAQRGISPDDVEKELGKRFGTSGLKEKENRTLK